MAKKIKGHLTFCRNAFVVPRKPRKMYKCRNVKEERTEIFRNN